MVLRLQLFSPLYWVVRLRKIYNPIAVRRRIIKTGVSVGNDVNFIGSPIVSLAEGSVISIGNSCVLCSESESTALGVSHPVILRCLTKDAKVIIGTRCRMSGCSICAKQSVTLGDRVVIGSGVWIADTDFHSLDPGTRSSPQDLAGAASLPVVIEDDVFLGGRSVILKGVTLGRGSVVGAGSIVTRSVAAGMIVAGNPAKVIGSVSGGELHEIGGEAIR